MSRMLRAALLLGALAIGGGCRPTHADVVCASRAPRSFQTDERAQAVRLAGALHRLVAAHPTIPVVVEASCPDFASFLGRRALDAACAVSGFPGQTFHGRVTAVRRTHAVGGPVPADHVYGLITVDVDNREARILPGALIATSFVDTRGSPLVLFGRARLPEPEQPEEPPRYAATP